jgi:prepilin signal peptidase PulO-like enzyme (type II secretory pathway)
VTGGRNRVLAVGGYVSSSDESSSGPSATASAVYRVPANRWDEALDGIRGLATKIRQLQVQTEAVTSQVVDLGARITNLRASEAALQKIMAQATKISDVLDVQRQLTSVRDEIERLVAEKTVLQGRAALGTLTVTYNLPAPPATEEVRRGWDPATDADKATGTLIGLGQTAASIGIWLGIVGLPVAIVAAIIVGLAWRVSRFVSRRGGVEPGTS